MRWIPAVVLVLSLAAAADVQKPTPFLLLQMAKTFVATGDLKHALEVLKKAVKLYPENPDLWKLYGRVLLWTGKPKEALNAFLRAYKLEPDEKLAKTIAFLAVQTENVEVAKKFRKILKSKFKILEELKSSSPEYIKRLIGKSLFRAYIAILLYFGEIEKAFKYIQVYTNVFGFDEELFRKLIYILYKGGKYKEAYRLLREYYPFLIDKPDLLALLSDMAWLSGDKDYAVKISEKLIKEGKGRIADYDRVSYALLTSNPVRAAEYALEGWKRFGTLYLLKRGFYAFYLAHLYRRMETLFNSLPPDVKRSLLRDFYFDTTFASALLKEGKLRKALNLLLRAYRLGAEKGKLTPSFVNYILSVLAKSGRQELLRKFLLDLRKKVRKDKNLYLSLSYGYLLLGKPYSALSFYGLSPIKDCILKSDILTALGKEEEANLCRWKVYRKLLRSLHSNPKLAQNTSFVQNLLRVSIYFLQPQKYEKLLYLYRGKIPADIWNAYYEAYLLKWGHYDFLKKALNGKKTKGEPWLLLAVYIHDYELLRLKGLLNRYGGSLPVRDRVNAYILLGLYDKAMEVAVDGLDGRPYDWRLYKQLVDLVNVHRGYFQFENKFLTGKLYSLRNTSFKAVYKTDKEILSLKLARLDAFKVDKDVLRTPPVENEFKVSLSEDLKRFGFGLSGNVLQGLGTSIGLKLSGFYKPAKPFKFSLSVFFNEKIDDTLYLTFGGVQSGFTTSLLWNMSGRNYILSSFSYSKIRSRKGFFTGSKREVDLYFNHRWRIYYPGVTFQVYLRNISYVEQSWRGYEQLSAIQSFKVLPKSFTDAGFSVSWGMEQKYLFTGLWKTFGTLSVGYITSSKTPYVSAFVGIGGPLFGPDNLSFEIGYSGNVAEGSEKTLSVNLVYRFYY